MWITWVIHVITWVILVNTWVILVITWVKLHLNTRPHSLLRPMPP